MYKLILNILLLSQGLIMSAPFSFQFPTEVEQFTLKSASYIKASDDVNLAYYSFIPTNPDNILIFYHGCGIWSNKIYQYMAQQLSEKHNIGVYLFDTRGHGNSEGPRGDAPFMQQVWQDVSTAIDFVSKEHGQLPVFLGGHSSGAGLVLNYSDWNQHKAVKGYVLLAPFLGPQSKTLYEHTDPSNYFIKKIQLFYVIASALTNGFLFKHTPAIFLNYPQAEKKKDSYILDYYTNAMMQATSPYDAQKLFSHLDASCFVVIGESDEQFIPEKVVEFSRFVPKKHNSLFQIMPKSTHLSIVFESVNCIAEWMKATK